VIVENTFEIEVDPFGKFVCRRPTPRDQIWIQAEARRTLGGGTDLGALALAAYALATAERCIVEAPAGWDLKAMDLVMPDDQKSLFAFYGRFEEEETRFRGRSAKAGVRPGAAA
jgi:hypothetical protein